MPVNSSGVHALTERRTWVLDFFLIVVMAAVLIWPIFKTKYYENWGTIDSTFIADGRYLSENLPHPGWQPLWYGGARFDYVYPPALRYGTALLTKALPIIPARAYHLYTAIFYTLGIGFIYLLVRIGSRARGYAWFAAMAAATLSPTYLFLAHIRADTQPFMPQRLNVLVRYGEGPHITSFSILPIALALAWYGLRAGKHRWLAGSAIACAAVVSNNFYGATSLAIFFPIVCWAVYTETRDWKILIRAAVTALLAYGLCASWLSPSFLKITSRNLALVAQPGNWWSTALALLAAAAFIAVTWRWARRGMSAWTIFVLGAALFFSLNVLGHYYFQFRVSGEPERLVPEADLCIILLLGLALHSAWNKWPDANRRALTAALAVALFVPGGAYLVKPWHHLVVRTSEYKHRLEYQIAEWVNTHRPGMRNYVTGTLRFWWNVWFSEAQLGGGSEQGLQNMTIMPMFWKLVLGNEGKHDKLWLQAFGVDTLIVNDKTSDLPICDFQHPHKYKGVLPVLWEDGKGNWIYEVPRKHPGLARVVESSRYATLREPANGEDMEAVASYVAVLESPETPAASTRWLASDTLEIAAETKAGESLAIQVAHDPYWRAEENATRYDVSKDPFGQMRVDLPAEKHLVRMRFETPLENQIGRGLTAVSLLIAVILGLRRNR